jgi:hypothetical protein
MNERQKESLAFLKNPDLWVHVIMPVVKRSASGEMPEVGFVLPEGKAKVYKANMWALSPDIHLYKQLEGVPVSEYTSYEEMVTDGWEVD